MGRIYKYQYTQDLLLLMKSRHPTSIYQKAQFKKRNILYICILHKQTIVIPDLLLIRFSLQEQADQN